VIVFIIIVIFLVQIIVVNIINLPIFIHCYQQVHICYYFDYCNFINKYYYYFVNYYYMNFNIIKDPIFQYFLKKINFIYIIN
jgi:hypothetical protein